MNDMDSAEVPGEQDICAGCNTENDNFSEINEDETFIDADTMLDNYDPEFTVCDEVCTPEEITFAPGEGQVPLSVFKDENAEYLSFPTIFCGEKRPDNKEQFVNVHYSDICKYEL